jgi:hypothetical protein
VDLERQPGSNVVPKLAIGRTTKHQPSIAISANQVAGRGGSWRSSAPSTAASNAISAFY